MRRLALARVARIHTVKMGFISRLKFRPLTTLDMSACTLNEGSVCAFAIGTKNSWADPIIFLGLN